MKKTLHLIAYLIIICFTLVTTAEALYIGIENVGSAPLAAISLNFNIETSPGIVEFFQVFSHRAQNDPTNSYFPFYFDEFDMIAPGGAFDTFLIPELTGNQTRLVGYGISTFNAGIGATGPFLDITPDFTTIDLLSSSSAIPLAVRVSFYSGGVPVPTNTPVPEPATMLLLGSGLIGLVGFKRKLRG